jgi:hypothetical protein
MNLKTRLSVSDNPRMITFRRGGAVLALVSALALLPAAVVTASGVHEPDADTQSASQVVSSGARLQGRIKPRDATTNWWFEYGTTKSYGESTPVESASANDDWASVTKTVTGLAPGTKYHFRLVATNSGGTKRGDDKTFTTSTGSGDPGSGTGSGDGGSGDSGSGDSGSGNSGSGDSGPGNSGPGDSGTGGADSQGSGSSGEPELGKTVGVEPVDGLIRVRKPDDKGFGALDPNGTVPTGTVIDATRGKVMLTTAVSANKTQTATFWGGVFQVRQSRTGHGYTDLYLRGPSLGKCPARGQAASSAKRRSRSLWGKDRRGRYRTHGRNSVATVRGTTWLTTETCAGTVTWVRQGAVAVRDKHRKRTVLVRAGHAYLAHSRG